MAQDYFVHELNNGLVLLAERLDHVASTSVQLSLPVGASRDTEPLSGAANVVAEWLFRGAAGRDSRQLHDAFDALGCQHDQSVRSAFVQLRPIRSAPAATLRCRSWPAWRINPRISAPRGCGNGFIPLRWARRPWDEINRLSP